MASLADVAGDWGDEAYDEDYIPDAKTEGPDGRGVITRTEFAISDSGQKQKITTRMKTVTVRSRVTPAMKRRRKLPKFGMAMNSGSEENVTYRSVDEIGIDSPSKKEQDSQALIDSIKAAMAKKRPQNTFWADKRKAAGMKLDTEGEDGAGSGNKTGTYVAPGRREGATGSSFRDRDDSCTLRVTNISPDTRDADLQELFRRFGAVSRVYLAKDKETGASRGFAFVSYHMREDAKRALQKLHGYGYDHLILSVQWAQPSKKKDPGAQTTTYRSGYGKALPQGRG